MSGGPLITDEVTTYASCWKVTRTDGLVFGFTGHSHDISAEGVIFRADLGHTPTSIVSSATLSVDNLEITTFLDSSSITEEDVVAGLWDFAEVVIYRVNYENTILGGVPLKKGWLGEVRIGRASLKAELRGATQPLQSDVGRIYASACDADLGDARCGVVLATYTVTGAVTSITSNRIFSDSGRGETAQYFTYGRLTWTSGANSGRGMEVKGFSAGVFELQEAMAGVVAVGDTYSVYAGCDKVKTTGCIAKFNNAINFRGFDKVPGGDRMVSGK
jgi:uncharacterized phage protein (TIGR02218 family)